MNKYFNDVQMQKSSENCDKYSKSVSYETLVAGTATIGREYKQTRRLFLGSVDKPLTAVGTLTSLLCNSAKVVEKWLQTLPVFRLVKIIILISVLSVGMVAESRADDVIPTSGTCNADGTCLWSLGSDGALTIYAKDGAKDVMMDDYYCLSNPCEQSSLISRPWENNLQQIKSVYIGDNITNIGDDAFQNASNLTSVTGMKDVKTIGDEGVFAYTGLREITIPDGVTYIGLDAFNLIKNMKSVTLPDTINNIGTNTSPFLENQAEINCLNTHGQCENLHKLIKDMIGDKTFNTISPTSNCETYNNKGCTSCEKEYFLADGMCWAPWEKKHYTPAEAAKWLKEEDNTITITFKK